MTKIHYVVVQTSSPRGSFPGRVQEGHYTVDNDVVTLTAQDGSAIYDSEGRKITGRVGEGQTAKRIAARLLRATLDGRGSNNFSQPIRYEKLGWL
jgi:hypothetical protein